MFSVLPRPERGSERFLFFDDPLWIASGLGLIVLLVLVGLALHELGHWVFAKLGGYRVLGFSVGEGRAWWAREAETWFVHLRTWPTEGYILCVKEMTRETRSQSFLVSAGGPLFTALFAVACFGGYGLSSPERALAEPARHVLSQSCGVVGFLECLVLLYNVWPRMGMVGGQPVRNDGAAMLAALRQPGAPWSPFYEAHLEEVRKAYGLGGDSEPCESNREHFLRFVVWLHLEQRGMKTENPGFRGLELLGEFDDSSPDERLLCLEQTVELAHLYRDNELTNRVRQIIEEELSRPFEHPLLKARLGALAVESGDFTQARLLLLEGEEHLDQPESRAYCLAWLACLDSLCGHPREAESQLKEAAKLDPSSEAVRRVRDRIFGPAFRGDS